MKKFEITLTIEEKEGKNGVYYSAFIKDGDDKIYMKPNEYSYFNHYVRLLINGGAN